MDLRNPRVTVNCDAQRKQLFSPKPAPASDKMTQKLAILIMTLTERRTVKQQPTVDVPSVDQTLL